MDIPESTPIKCKIKLPFNGTAIMRITEVQFVAVRKHLTASINATTLISSANDDKNDIAWIDLGNVTYGSSENGTQIKIEFEVCHDSKNRNRFLMSVLVLATTSESHRVGLSHSALCFLLLYMENNCSTISADYKLSTTFPGDKFEETKYASLSV